MAHEFTKIEWWDVCRRLVPTLTWEEYEEIWQGFLACKEAHARKDHQNGGEEAPA